MADINSSREKLQSLLAKTDESVYGLYGVSEEEREIIEGR